MFAAPPDAPAREAVLAEQLGQRPTRDLDLACLVARTEGWSNADLRQLVDSAARQAVVTSMRTGQLTPVDMWELKWALRAMRPATAAWFTRAQQAADGPGDRRWYSELRDYLLCQSAGAATGSMPRSR